MKKTNLSRHLHWCPNFTRYLMCTFFLSFMFLNMGSSQTAASGSPALACNNLQISLDNLCQGVTADQILGGNFPVPVTLKINGVTIGTALSENSQFMDTDGNIVDFSAYVDQTVNYEALEESGNSCWGQITFELKLLPELMSPCTLLPGETTVEEIKYSDLAAGTVTLTYNTSDPCQDVTVIEDGDVLYSCALGDDGLPGTADDGWCTASCVATDNGNGTVSVNLVPSPGDPSGALIPASRKCKVTIDVSECVECIAWCSEEGSRSYPEGFVTVEEILEMIDKGCFATIEGGIQVVEDIDGDACESVTKVAYFATVSRYDGFVKEKILEQAFRTVKLDHDIVRAPLSPVVLDCGDVSVQALPGEIAAATGSGSKAFPFFADKHAKVKREVIVCGLAHFEVVVDTMEQTVAVDIDTDKDGIDDDQVWVLLPVVTKELRDTLVCDTIMVDMLGAPIVLDKDGNCDATAVYQLLDFKNNPIKITSPVDVNGTPYAGNVSIAASATCDPDLVSTIVHIDDDKYCNLIVSYSDQGPFEACGSGFKIIRNWTVIDWCDAKTGPFDLGNQFIEVLDLEPPYLPDLVDDAVSIDPWTCTAKYKMNLPQAKDGCDGSDIEYRVHVSEGFYDKTTGFLTGIWPNTDPIDIIVKVADDCGNARVDTFALTVYDGVAPVPVCVDKINVSLTTGGVAKVFATDLDAGSHDAGCGDVIITAARMTGCCDDECAGGDEVCTKYDKFGECVEDMIRPEYDEFGDFVKFCCEDAGQTIMVVLKIQDHAGNVNICMVEVDVADKSASHIDCKDHVIKCVDDMESVDKAFAIGAVCESATPDLWKEEMTDNGCGTGFMTREWWIDNDGDGELGSGDAYCKQKITIEADDATRFDPYTIKWPKHYTGEYLDGVNLECGDAEIVTRRDEYGKVIGTDTVPTVVVFEDYKVPMGDVFACASGETGEVPVWCNSPCGLVGYSVETEEVIASDACKKLIKRWTVIDWCTWDANSSSPQDDSNDTNFDQFEAVEDWAQGVCAGCDEDLLQDSVYLRYNRVNIDGYYTYDQVVKVVDDSAPEIEVAAEYVVNTTGGAAFKGDDKGCTGSEGIIAKATDLCGGEATSSEFLNWTVKLIKGGEVLAVKNGIGSEIEMNSGEGSPGDEHTIEWTVSDGCGNASSSKTIVAFGDEKAPTPICISGVTTAFMQETGTVTIWSADFDLGSFDNCTEVTHSMVPSGEAAIPPGEEGHEGQKSYTFDCNDLANFADFDVYVWDANGNSDFCTVGLLVGGDCPEDDGSTEGGEEEGSSYTIAGSVSTANGDMINNVIVKAESNAGAEFPKLITTGTSGAYAFSNNPVTYDYEITASKNDAPMNGVTTVDLVMIQKMIIGLEEFDTPYKHLAADINNNGEVTVSDLVELRRMILGVFTDFPRNESWRFVAASQVFSSTQSPWPFTENIQIDALSSALMNEDFIGIKIGDINDNAQANGLMKASTRSDKSLHLVTQDIAVEAGQLVRVPVSAQNFAEVSGYQFTLDHKGLSLSSVEAGALNIDETNIAEREEQLTMSWSEASAVSADDVLFTLVFSADVSAELSQLLDLNSSITPAEAYAGADLEVINVSLSIANAVDMENGYALYQNSPNPFELETTIGFDLPVSAQASFRIYDVAGKEILNIAETYNKGYNEIVLTKDQINVTGVLYYEIESGEFTATKKLIIID